VRWSGRTGVNILVEGQGRRQEIGDRRFEAVGVATEEDEANNTPNKLDAGALFVLKSRGIN
jgi:hypothetical protein